MHYLLTPGKRVPEPAEESIASRHSLDREKNFIRAILSLLEIKTLKSLESEIRKRDRTPVLRLLGFRKVPVRRNRYPSSYKNNICRGRGYSYLLARILITHRNTSRVGIPGMVRDRLFRGVHLLSQFSE